MEKPSVKVGDIITIKTMDEAINDKATLKNYQYTFGSITYEDMWGKDCEVDSLESGVISVKKSDYRTVCVPYAWVSNVVSKEETCRRKIEEYVSKHNFNESLPDENAPYDWDIVINKHHDFIKAYVVIDGFRFEVFEDPFGAFIVEEG